MEIVQWIYMICEALVALSAIFGNVLVIISFLKVKQLRNTTNSYIFSLAIADLLVGAVGIPLTLYTMITKVSVSSLYPKSLEWCLFFNTWIMMLCTVSIQHLLAVSVDRYRVIVWNGAALANRHGASRRGKIVRAVILIALAWIIGIIIGNLPVLGWNRGMTNEQCVFMEVMDLRYLIFLFGVTIILPTMLMGFFYVSIYLKVKNHHQNLVRTISPENESMQERVDQRRKRIIFSLFIVIISFLIGWYPLYILNTVKYFCPTCNLHPILFYLTIVFTHTTSTVNPLIYAYTMPGFSDAFREILRIPLTLKSSCLKNVKVAQSSKNNTNNNPGHSQNQNQMTRIGAGAGTVVTAQIQPASAENGGNQRKNSSKKEGKYQQTRSFSSTPSPIITNGQQHQQLQGSSSSVAAIISPKTSSTSLSTKPNNYNPDGEEEDEEESGQLRTVRTLETELNLSVMSNSWIENDDAATSSSATIKVGESTEDLWVSV